MVISIRVVLKMNPIKYYVGLFLSFFSMAGFVGSDSNTIVGLSLLVLGAGIVLTFWGITQIRSKTPIPLTLAEVEELKRKLKKC